MSPTPNARTLAYAPTTPPLRARRPEDRCRIKRGVAEAAPLEFRRFQPYDAPAVRDLHVLALRSTGAFIEPNDDRDWDRDLENIEEVYLRPGGEFLVGVLGGEIVAMGALRLDQDGSATLKRMRVHPRCQRRGYGRELLGRLEEAARQRRVTHIVLDLLPVQNAALALYLSRGYVETHRAWRDGIELLFME